MKITVVLTLMLAFFYNYQSNAQISQQVVQLHQIPSNITTLHLQLPSNKVKIVKTKSSRLSIETVVNLNAGSPPLLDYLIKAGRYELQAKADNNSSTLTLGLKKSPKVLIIKGAVCEENITYTIHVPEYLLKVTTSYSSITAALSK